MRSYLTYQQLDALVRFADEDRELVDMEAVDALMALSYAVQRNLNRRLTGTLKRNKMLQERLESRREAEQERIEAGQIEESNRDSLLVARALLYQLQHLKTYRLTPYKVNAILYEMYASWLYSKKVRLFLEHPVATEWGPRLWHAFKKINVNERISDEEWNFFAANNPAVAAFVTNSARKYYEVTESTLTKMFMETKAFRNASASANGGKWNKEIADADIYEWKQRQAAQNKKK